MARVEWLYRYKARGVICIDIISYWLGSPAHLVVFQGVSPAVPFRPPCSAPTEIWRIREAPFSERPALTRLAGAEVSSVAPDDPEEPELLLPVVLAPLAALLLVIQLVAVGAGLVAMPESEIDRKDSSLNICINMRLPL